MPGGRCGLYPALEKRREELARKRSEERAKPCPMRHQENGNCLPHGGFCLNAVSDSACEVMHKAYEMGYTAGAARAESEAEQPLTLEELRGMDGQPAWFVSIRDGFSCWGIVRVVNMSKVWFIAVGGAERAFGDRDTYGVTWVAYRRPPVKRG